MKTLREMRQFYETQLLADLKVLERKRRKVLRKLIITGAVLISMVAAVALLVLMNPQIGPSAIVISVMASLAIACFVHRFIGKDYIVEFKILVIDRIVRFLDNNLNYDRRRYIPQSTFMLSQIFTTTPNRYKGDDFVSGTVGETKIQFCELKAQYESGSGKNRTVKTVFKGLFFIGDFNKNFTCQTVVLPDNAEKFFGRLGQKLQSMNFARDDLVRLDNPEFEKHFVVYSNDQVGARYILSTSLMERIVGFKKKSNQNIHLSFVGSMVFVAISFPRNLFEPRIFRTLLDFEPIREYFEDLQLAIQIVDDLNLNTRIWTKR